MLYQHIDPHRRRAPLHLRVAVSIERRDGNADLVARRNKAVARGEGMIAQVMAARAENAGSSSSPPSTGNTSCGSSGLTRKPP